MSAESPVPPLSAPGRRWRRWLLLVLGPVVVVAGAGTAWLVGGRYVITDDASVEADKITISSDVPGIVAAVLVHENEAVAAGQPLFRLDQEPFRIAVASAEARLAMVANDLAALQANDYMTLEQLKAAEDDLRFYDREYRRKSDLAARKVVAESQLDVAGHDLDSARQKLAALKEQVVAVRAQLGGDPDLPVQQQARYRQAQADLDKARRDLAHTQVSAPVDAIVTHVDSLQPGQYLIAAAPALSLVSTGRVWIEANPKETDLTHVVPGQPADVSIDGYPGRHWRAVVASVSPATGSEFAMLPAQNVSGNWIKVVQRIPVRLRLEATTDGPPLRAGMSATVAIDTGRQRSLAALFQTTFARVGDTE
jgi:membrane fusion protein (multidrug efflux system)